MTRDDVQRWLDAYVEAWRSYEPGAIGALFAADAEYNVWLLRFDDDGRCTEFVEYWRELPESRRPAMA